MSCTCEKMLENTKAAAEEHENKDGQDKPIGKSEKVFAARREWTVIFPEEHGSYAVRRTMHARQYRSLAHGQS